MSPFISHGHFICSLIHAVKSISLKHSVLYQE